jgi:D-apiose dehydrogenase
LAREFGGGALGRAMGLNGFRGVTVGTGYFSQFHFDAWYRVPGVEIVAVCSRDDSQAYQLALQFGIPKLYADVATMLDAEQPDFVDIITPPESHAEIARLAGDRGIHIICQKPLTPGFDEARAIVADAARAGVRFMVHDNFRFQPWHREIKSLLGKGTIGSLQSIACRTRMGDGWSENAYLDRQPYFREMKRFLIFETGVHFIDVYRYLGGEITSVFAKLRCLNTAIAGEDSGIVFFDFANGATGLWDASRYHESAVANPRYTFGDFWVDGTEGSLRLDGAGEIYLHRLGEPETIHSYPHSLNGFAGDCVHAALSHFIERLRDGAAFETEGFDYLRTLAVQEAVYESAERGQAMFVAR